MKSLLLPLALLAVLPCCRMLQPVKDYSVHHLLEPLVPDRSLTVSNPSLAISRPSLPGYLDRAQLITRSSGSLKLSPLDLWAEPLDSAISRVTAGNLSRLTGSTNIQPVESFTSLDYTRLLELRISRFDPDDHNLMILHGTWKLQAVSGQQTSTRYFRFTAPILPEPAAIASRVSAMNQCLEQLARQIAAGLTP